MNARENMNTPEMEPGSDIPTLDDRYRVINTNASENTQAHAVELDRGIPSINSQYSVSGIVGKIAGGIACLGIAFALWANNSDPADDLSRMLSQDDPKDQHYDTGFRAAPQSSDATDPLYKKTEFVMRDTNTVSKTDAPSHSQVNDNIVPLKNILPEKQYSNRPIDPAVNSTRHYNHPSASATGTGVAEETLARWAAPPVVSSGSGRAVRQTPALRQNHRAGENGYGYGNGIEQMEQQLAMLSGASGAGGNNLLAGLLPGARENSDKAFARKVSEAMVETAIAMPTGNTVYKILQGKVIRATLESAINTTLPGRIRALVSHDVYGETGREVLIPRGSRIVGEYNNDIKNGQTRVFVMWPRVMRTDGIDIALGSAGTDNLGRAGIAGDIESRFFQRFGSAALMSVIGVGAALSGSETQVATPAGNLQNRLANSFQVTAGQDVERYADIPDTHSTDQGRTILIYVAKDLDFNAALNPHYNPRQ